MTSRILDDAIANLDFETAHDATVTLEVPDVPGLPESEAEVSHALMVGLFDVIIEDEIAANPQDGASMLNAALRRVQSLAAVTRFALFEHLDTAERQERGARMNGLDIMMTRNWMLPRLRRDLHLYAERIDALRRAFEDDAK